MKRMSNFLFVLALMAAFPALLWEHGARQTTIVHLYERWSGYASLTWKAIIVAVAIASVLALFDHLLTASRRKRAVAIRRRNERNRAQERHQRCREQIIARWSADTGIPQVR